MREAAAIQDYEQAARLRDDIGALERALEKNAVVLQDGTDADIFALVGDDLEAAVQVFHVRNGRIRGQRGWIVEKVEDVSDGELVEHLLQQVYGAEEEVLLRSGSRSRGDARDVRTGVVPREVLVPVMPPDAAQVSAWLSGLRGSRVDVRVPQRGDKRELAETVRRNAEQARAAAEISEATHNVARQIGLIVRANREQSENAAAAQETIGELRMLSERAREEVRAAGVAPAIAALLGDRARRAPAGVQGLTDRR
jgi:excinuclease UvrABC nuclease subunit